MQGALGRRLQAQLQKRIDEQRRRAGTAEPYVWSQEPEEARIGEATTRALTEKHFPCAQCGAALNYAIGTRSLACQYCGHTNQITDSAARIRENDLQTALRELERSTAQDPTEQEISCPNCAAHFSLDTHLHAGECPFCSTAVVTESGRSRSIKPRGLLPFSITAEQAREAYRQWLGKRWFAPGALKKYARSDTNLNGVYIPYWTYDSDTKTAYQGQRGEVYYVTQRYTTTVNGRRVSRTRQVPKVRWYPASGRTTRHFDDVLVGATRTLPRKITDWLAPWDLHNLVPYTEDYLAGFSSEVYQVDLDEGFDIAQSTMDKVIRDDVRNAIGGDQQRIQRITTKHSDTTFKHVLLPLWTAGFQFRGKTYRFVVNGRTGKVRGERPYSIVKIALAGVAGTVLTASTLFVVDSGTITSHGVDWHVPSSGRPATPSRWPEMPLIEGFPGFEQEAPRIRFD
ncbi:MAG: hypothetical protein AB8B63_05965 [Granulosicoccus sp.]